MGTRGLHSASFEGNNAGGTRPAAAAVSRGGFPIGLWFLRENDYRLNAG